MQTINLRAGESYEVDAATFDGNIEIKSHRDIPWLSSDTENAVTKVIPNKKILIREVTATTEVTLKPGTLDSEFPSATEFFVEVLLRGSNTRVTLPPLLVGGKTNATILRLVRENEKLLLVAPTSSAHDGITGSAAVIQEILSTADNEPTPRDTIKNSNIVVLVDSTASFNLSATEKQLKAIAEFTNGLILLNDFKAYLATTSGSSLPKLVSETSELFSCLKDNLSYRDVGWTLTPEKLNQTIGSFSGFIVISDDIPGQLLAADFPVHVLATQPVTSHRQNITVTYFDDSLVDAIEAGDSERLKKESTTMYETLTMNKVGNK